VFVFNERHTIKPCREVNVELHAFSISDIDGCAGTVSGLGVFVPGGRPHIAYWFGWAIFIFSQSFRYFGM
jgi:hypothetical protein